MRIKFVVSAEELEQASLDSLWELCPICGQQGKNNVCKEHGKWKKGYFYFSSPSSISSMWPWEDKP